MYHPGMAFLGAFLAATAALLVAGLLPLPLAGVLLGWLILAGAGWWYVRATSGRLKTLPQPAGCAMGMGALLGVCIRVAVLGLRYGYDALVRHQWPHDAWALAAIEIAVVSAAVLGAIGGLIAALQVPNVARASRASLVIAGVVGFVALVVGAGAVLWVFVLAKAMSDSPG
jgi:hypothetical protein